MGVRSLFDDIDADKNGSLDAGEMHALAQVAIFVVLAVDGDGCYASSNKTAPHALAQMLAGVSVDCDGIQRADKRQKERMVAVIKELIEQGKGNVSFPLFYAW
jgi:hypothetical protein